ncbi:glycosyltransferase family 2 protein [Methanobacterium formicicum]|uniref:Family 2 glycosyl transferase n=1 Tax=Methanobacterium formicicum (strain DSM 3637 / PP1) TaxID=1204725 RepID=K2R3Y7_METFP|nr:glycosyltransferase family 2 protein [Methanobacterium formicicum]EKF85897.1 family 2 glycosyl transferase [Methanobacterium formicicum DSM 3637]
MVLGTRQHVLRVIVVDDGSHDKTADIARLAGAKVLVHPQNQGKGAALKTGFKAAKDADIIVTLDSDGQHEPEEIPKLFEPIINGEADIVNGSRYLNGNGKETPAYRRVGQNVLDTATNISGKMDVTDSQSGFRAFAGHTLPLFRFHSTGYTIESEMLIEASKAGLRIKEVEITTTYGEDSHHKKNPLSHGVSVLVRILQDMEFNRPLYYFTIPGLILVLIGMILGLKFFGEYLGGQMTTLFPTTLAGLIAIFGTFIAFTGLILHSVSRMIWRAMGK